MKPSKRMAIILSATAVAVSSTIVADSPLAAESYAQGVPQAVPTPPPLPVKGLPKAAPKPKLKRPAFTRAPAPKPHSPKDIARAMLAAKGWSKSQFPCLDRLWTRESGWRTTAKNPSSGAYGIPQSLPGSKMASAGKDWKTNPTTQIKWGLSYIKSRYGSPCGAWAHSQATGWY